MDNGYWIGRKRAAMTMARNASTAEARLIHYEMAGRYSVKAAHSLAFLAAAAASLAAKSRREARRPAAMLARPIGRDDEQGPGRKTTT